MATLSLCMIVRNEESCLTRCLASVNDGVDEIVIVDTGSQDATKDIANNFADHVYDYKWTGSFSEARNFSISKSTMDWILVLDADEVVSPDDMVEIRSMLNNTDRDAFFLTQRNYTNDHTQPRWVPLERPVRESKDYLGYVRNPCIRLFRNGRGIHFSGVVHEVADPSVAAGQSQILEIPIHHYCEEKDQDARQLGYLEICEKALKDKPDGRLYAIAGAVHLNVRGDAQRALAYFRKAVECGYKTDLCRENVAECHVKLGQRKEALAIYKQLVNEGQGSVALLSNMAYLLVNEKEFTQALEHLERAVVLAGDPQTREDLKQKIMYTRQLINKCQGTSD